MPKYEEFFTQLNNVLSTVGRNDVKERIGDSVNNNRTLTVSQVIRFLEGSRSAKNKRLGQSLLSVYNIIGTDAVSSRNNNRVDALDINEFLDFYGSVVILGGEYRNIIGRNVSI